MNCSAALRRSIRFFSENSAVHLNLRLLLQNYARKRAWLRFPPLIYQSISYQSTYFSLEPVPKRSPCFETGLFLAKCEKKGKTTVFQAQIKAKPQPNALYRVCED
jgi:hypothetical protein